MGKTETYIQMMSSLRIKNMWSKLALALTFISCTSTPSFSDLEIVGTATLVCCEGKAFTGTAWSSDGKTMSITCHDGIMDSMMVYHANGRKAIKSMTLYGKGDCFDASGKAISMEELIENYPGLIDQVASASYELKGL